MHENIWNDLTPEVPVVSGSLAIFPVPGKDEAAPGYLLLEDALREGVARVTEVNAGGHVPVLLVENRGELPILALQGEELIGAKQNRTLNVSMLLATGKTEVPVTCVEQGRWAYKSPDFAAGGFEHLDLRAQKAEMVLGSLKSKLGAGASRYAADQGAVWGEVEAQAMAHEVHSPTGALGDVYGSRPVRSKIDKVVKDLELPANTRGMVVAVGGDIVASELFEVPRIFRRIWPRLRQSYAFSAIAGSREDQQKEFTRPTREQAEHFLRLPAELPSTVHDSVGLGRDVRWEGSRVLAFALLHEERLLHGTIYRRWEQAAGRDEHSPARGLSSLLRRFTRGAA